MCIASEEHGKYYSVHKQLICVAGDGNWTGKSALRASGLKTGDVWALQSLKAHKVQKSYFKKSVGEGLYRSFFYVLKCGSFRLRFYSPPRLPAANDASERRSRKRTGISANKVQYA